MPWMAADARRHTSKATSKDLRKLWAHVANETLAQTGDEGRAVREANAAVDKARGSRRTKTRMI
jgi:hypothetical protein